MFYSENILAKRGPLAKVWLAAHWERKLSKTQFLQANIPSSISAIVEDYGQPLALRLSGQLLLGVVRIFSRKTRYLLEDCSEALVKIKMAFRPGMVDLTDEQAVATIGAITVGESITEFDMLMPDPVLDLKSLLTTGPSKSNTSRFQDITLQPDFLSFSQQLPDDLDKIGSRSGLFEQGDISFEVGRDAQTGRGFTPGPDALSIAGSFREKSVGPADPLLAGDLSFELGLGGEGPGNNDFGLNFENLETEAPLIAPAAERLDGGDFEFNDDYGPVDMDFTINGDESALKEFASEMEPLRFDGDKSEAPFIKRAGKKRGAHIAKKLKTLIDEKIELSSEFLRAQLNNTSDICGKETFLSASRMLTYLDARKRKFLTFQIPSHFSDVEAKIRKLSVSADINPNTTINYPKQDDLFQSVNDDYGDLDFGEAGDISMQLDGGSPSKRQRSFSREENESLLGLNESIFFGDAALKKDLFDFDFAPDTEDQLVDTLSSNSLKIISVIKGKIAESSKLCTSFDELSEEASRPIAAKLFFELLSLKSKRIINLSQESSFGNIVVSVVA